MAYQVLQRTQPNYAEIIGGGLGEGIKTLAGNKLKQIQTRNGLRSLLPKDQYSDADVEEISHSAAQNPQMLNEISKQALKQRGEVNYARQFSGGQQGVGAGIMPNQQYSQGQTQDTGGSEGAQQQPRLLQQVQKMIQQGYPVPRNSKEAQELFKTANELDRQAYQDTKELRTQAREEERVADDRLEDLSRLEELEDEGLNSPGFIEGMANLGLDIPAFLNDPTQEAQKIIQSFSRDIGKSFKGSISQFELEQFLSTIPNLLQSPEGRKRVISGLKKLYRLKSEFGKQLRIISDDNPGIRPEELDSKLDKAMKPIREKIKKQFYKDLKRKVPEGQSKFMTALQIGGSKALSKLYSAGPALAKSALKSVAPIVSPLL